MMRARNEIYKTKRLLGPFFASIYYVINIYPKYFIWLTCEKIDIKGGAQATQMCFKKLVSMGLISIGSLWENERLFVLK